MGKLSDEDYQKTKIDLQKELATVMAEVDRVKAELSSSKAAAAPASTPNPAAAATGFVCPSCSWSGPSSGTSHSWDGDGRIHRECPTCGTDTAVVS